MFLLDTNVVSELRKVGDGKAELRTAEAELRAAIARIAELESSR